MNRFIIRWIPAIFGLLVCSCTSKTESLYHSIDKIDTHVHLRTNDTAVIAIAREEGFRYLTICTRSERRTHIDSQLVYAVRFATEYPETVSFLTTISMEGFGQTGWAEGVIGKLRSDFENGAVGVKIWKDIGMTFRDSLGNFIFIDDPRFHPVLQFIESSGKTVLAHIGEPGNCWLPIDSMTVNNDKIYFRDHPQYHMYLHPDYPSHERLMESRDHILAAYPDLKLVGAHLGSLEWDVDVLARRLERYPNFAVDMAARICHFQVQDREKVRNFIIKYQDRLLYGTDLGISGNMTDGNRDHWKSEWRGDWSYFATGDTLSSSRVDSSFRGLDLDKQVLRKIYATNARRWYPGLAG